MRRAVPTTRRSTSAVRAGWTSPLGLVPLEPLAFRRNVTLDWAGEAPIVMNRPSSLIPGSSGDPVAGHERQCLEWAIRLQTLPCVVVESRTATLLLSNDEARRMFLDRPCPESSREDYYATGSGGERIESDQLVAYLIGCEAGGDGVELTLYGTGDPRSYRVSARVLARDGARGELSMLTFLDVTGQRRAEGELRDAVEARDEFFSVATHELKDPLFSLQLSIQLLRHVAERHGPIPAHVLQHLDVSERQVMRLGGLIDNMLDFARITSGRFQLDLESLDLCELAYQMVGRFQAQAASSGTVLAAEPCSPVVGSFDRLKLEQVLGNLLSNAIKYGAGRPVAVRVWPEAEWAIVEVQDSGPGIAPEDQPRIFERFERASQRHKRASLGLGLYIVRSMVEAHGGSVEVRSRPGQGSTFAVRIPWKKGPGEVASLGSEVTNASEKGTG